MLQGVLNARAHETNWSPLINSIAFVTFIVDLAGFVSKLLMDLPSADAHKTKMSAQDYVQHKHVRIPTLLSEAGGPAPPAF